MLKQLSTYQSYINFISEHFAENKERFSTQMNNSDYSKALFKMVWLDVDGISEFISSHYSLTGRPAIHQMEILRSLVLMSHFKCRSFKVWAKRLKEDPLLAILSGFEEDDTPSFSNFYDFVSRFYKEEKKKHILECEHFKNTYSKPKGKNAKLVNHSKQTVDELSQKYMNGHKENLAEDDLNILFNKLAVEFSLSKGLIEKEMVLSGDGSALHIHSNHYGTPVKEDRNLRFYSDVDADIGYDSALECFYFGYSEYNLSVHNDKCKIDLPVFLTLAKASQHDAITSIKSLAAFMNINKHFKPTHICLDSASDNYAMFDYASYLKITPIIDLNKRNTGNNIYAPFNDISENGVPVCQNNEEMKYFGCEYKRRRHKYRCPHYKDLKNCKCPFKESCSKSEYGRTVYIKFDKDIKLFGEVPYKSPKWIEIYKNRTCTERINTRLINDYGLKDSFMHGRKINYFLMIMAGINIHLDAYYKVCALPGLTNN